MPNTVRASATALPKSRRLFLVAGTTGALFATLKGVATAAAPVVSENVRAAIAAHKAIQARIDGMTSENEAAWDAALDAERDARWALTEMPCQSDADFFAKAAHLLAHDRYVQGRFFTHDTDFGELAFAIELHLEQKGRPMAKRTFRAKSVAPLETHREYDDPVVAIGEKIAAAVAAQNDVKDVGGRDYLALCDYVAALEALAMSQPATSFAGCMLQVAIMNQMFSNSQPDESPSEFSNKEAARRFEVAVYSVIDVLFRACGRAPATIGCDYYAGVQVGLAGRLRRLVASAAREEGAP
jgi:hypothetical protein